MPRDGKNDRLGEEVKSLQQRHTGLTHSGFRGIVVSSDYLEIEAAAHHAFPAAYNHGLRFSGGAVEARIKGGTHGGSHCVGLPVIHGQRRNVVSEGICHDIGHF